MRYMLDLFVELICLSFADEHYEETLIKNIATHSPTENSQSITVEAHNGDKYLIEVRKL